MTFQKENLEFQKETRISMQHLENQITQLATVLNKLYTQSGKIPTQPEPHVKNVTVVTIVSSSNLLESSKCRNFMTEEEFDELFGFDKKGCRPRVTKSPK